MLFSALLMISGLSFAAGDPDDDDGDGYGESAGDCDDGDSSVYPGAPEICDGVDDDCDGSTDEGTTCSDDDGDGFTEDEGDCNDADPLVSPTAFETHDAGDNDCDGIIDEDTEAYDDDGDGYTELGGDCNDADSTLNPDETDWCRDDIDQDCSGSADDDCEESDDDGCDPDLSVALSLSRFSAPAGGVVEVTADVISTDRAMNNDLLWSVTGGTLDGEGESRSWTLPSEVGAFEISLSVADDCGYGMTARGTVRALAPEVPDTKEGKETGCGGKSAGALLFLGLGLGPLRRRRRPSQEGARGGGATACGNPGEGRSARVRTGGQSEGAEHAQSGTNGRVVGRGRS